MHNRISFTSDWNNESKEKLIRKHISGSYSSLKKWKGNSFKIITNLLTTDGWITETENFVIYTPRIAINGLSNVLEMWHFFVLRRDISIYRVF